MARNDPLNYIREFYKVPANKNRVVKVWRGFGVITGAHGPHVAVRISEEPHSRFYHPTDVDYLEKEHEEYKRLAKDPRRASPGQKAQEPAPGTEAPPVSKDAKDDPSPDLAPQQWKDLPGGQTTILHQLLTNQSGEADATCICGKWRLLRISTKGAQESPQRAAEIIQAYEDHLKAPTSS